MTLLLVALSLIVAVSSLLFCTWMYRQQRALQLELVKEQQSLQSMLEIVRKGSLGVGKRVLEVESRLNEVSESGVVSAGSVTSEYLPYNHALTMLQRGAGAQELVTECHLSEAEADLLSLIHAQKSQASKNTAGL
jgi:hypothetical protein